MAAWAALVPFREKPKVGLAVPRMGYREAALGSFFVISALKLLWPPLFRPDILPKGIPSFTFSHLT